MKSRRVAMVVMATLLIISVCLVFLLNSSLSAEPIRTLSVVPPEVVYDSLTIGQRFPVNVTVTNVTDLSIAKFRLSFNTAMLDVVTVAVLPEENLPIAVWEVDDASGTISMNVTYEVGLTTISPVALATFTFKMMNYGESPLHLYSTSLEDSLGIALEHQTIDGLVLIRLHDVAIVKVEPSTTQTYLGHNISITVVAANYGNTDENFTVTVYRNETEVCVFQVVNLSAGQNMTLSFEYNTSDATAGQKYVLKAEASIVPYEASTSNNLLVDGVVHVKIAGDVNADNSVDIKDLIDWDLAYGSYEGLPNWNPQADINGDGVVDEADGVLIVQNYRKTA